MEKIPRMLKVFSSEEFSAAFKNIGDERGFQDLLVHIARAVCSTESTGINFRVIHGDKYHIEDWRRGYVCMQIGGLLTLTRNQRQDVEFFRGKLLELYLANKLITPDGK